MRVVVPVILAGAILTTVSAADPIPPVTPRAPGSLPPLAGTTAGQLRSDATALAKEREEALKDAPPSAAATERALLRAQLMGLLKQINDRPPVPTSAPKTAPARYPRFDIPERPLDAIRMAENLFREGDVDAALRAFRLLDRTQLPKEDWAFVQYMSACCLRKMNKRAEAADIFREVADAKDDEFIAEYAITQLSLIRSTQELEAQLEQLRSRPKSR